MMADTKPSSQLLSEIKASDSKTLKDVTTVENPAAKHDMAMVRIIIVTKCRTFFSRFVLVLKETWQILIMNLEYEAVFISIFIPCYKISSSRVVICSILVRSCKVWQEQAQNCWDCREECPAVCRRYQRWEESLKKIQNCVDDHCNSFAFIYFQRILNKNLSK